VSTGLLVALLALVAPIAAAEPISNNDPLFHETYQVRAALGDIPTTNITEPPQFWNVEETIHFVVPDGGDANVTFTLPAGAKFLTATCSCGTVEPTWDGVRATFNTTKPGNQTLVFRHNTPVLSTEGFAFVIPDVPPERAATALLVFYLPDRFALKGPVEEAFALPSTSENPGLVIHGYQGTPEKPLPHALSFTAILKNDTSLPPPATTSTTTPVAPSPDSGSAGDVWTRTALVGTGGLIAGALVGVVVTRRFGRGAGLDAAPTHEPTEVLAARKRALVAALQALETAHDQGEVADAAYRTVHADLKAQALRVMRGIEARGDVPETEESSS